MKKTLTTITAGFLIFTASCTYNTNSGNNRYSSKGSCVPIVQPVVRQIYIEPVVEPVRIAVRSYPYRPVVLPPRCYNYIYID